MNNVKEKFDREGTEESILEMDAMSGGSGTGASTGSPGSRFKVDTTTARGEPIEVGSPMLSSHSAAMSSPAPPPLCSPERSNETPSRGQILSNSTNENDKDGSKEEELKPMAPRAPTITGVPTIELPDGNIITKDSSFKLLSLTRVLCVYEDCDKTLFLSNISISKD